MIDIEYDDKIAVIRLVRGKGNALNVELLTAIASSLDEVRLSQAQAAIITGQGSVFCAGVDLPALVEGGPEYARQFVSTMQKFFEKIAAFPKPLVGALNGHAIAGGAIITFACDQRLMARGTGRIGLTEVLVGVTFPAWALEMARLATPPQHFSTLAGTGRTWLPEEALSRGLIDELVEPEALHQRALAVAKELAAIPALAFTSTKLAVRRPMMEAARRQAALEDEALAEHWANPETLAKVEEFARRMIKSR